MNVDKRYKEICEYILSIPKFAKKVGTEEMSILLKRVGNPEKSYRSIHIAGTNGKGSVTTMISNILTESGLRVGVFTSPHLLKMNERIRIGSKDISDEDFVRVFDELMGYVDLHMKEGYQHPSFFEFVFVMAAMYFEDAGIDVAVFETGMGGRFDATNIVVPEVSVITSIGLDHMQYLGDTIEKIAYEKAGIIKKKVPVVSNTGDAIADEVIKKVAFEKEAVCHFIEDETLIINELSAGCIDFSISNDYYSLCNLKINTSALYQIDNARTAIRASYLFLENDNFSDERFSESVKNGLQGFYWTGRFEEISDHVVIDGAHNLDAVIRFTESVKSYSKSRNIKSIRLLFAVSSDKDYESMLRYITESLDIDVFYVTEYNQTRSEEADVVENILRKLSSRTDRFQDGFSGRFLIERNPDPKELLIKAKEELDGDSALFIFGSLYLVGEIKKCYEEVL